MKNITTLYPDFKSKALTFTYDDGLDSDIRMTEILNAHEMHGTFNLNSANMREDYGWETGSGYVKGITPEIAPSIYAEHEVAIHGLSHAFWTTIPQPRALYELIEDKRNLERIFGYVIRGMAYPFFSVNQSIVDMAKVLGLRYARGCGRELYYQQPADMFTWLPTCHHNDSDLFERADKFLSESFNSHQLFALAGHSFEFIKDRNFDLLEKFCDKMSNDKRIWYATNAEIFDYVHATTELVYSTDCSIVFNPTAYRIFVSVDGNGAVIEPGSTMSL